MKIETKFDLKQQIYDIYGHCWEVQQIELAYFEDGKMREIYRLGNKGTKNYNCCMLPEDKDRFFTSRAEIRPIKDKSKEIKKWYWEEEDEYKVN